MIYKVETLYKSGGHVIAYGHDIEDMLKESTKNNEINNNVLSWTIFPITEFNDGE